MKKVKLAMLKVNDRNPRTMTGEAFERLCASIKRDPQFMELRPIVVDKIGVILGGNMRYKACVALGMTEVPGEWVRTADKLTAEQRKRFIVVDNGPAGMSGEWDDGILAADYDLPMLEEIGFQLGESCDDIQPPADDGKPMCKCPKCGKEH